MSANQITAVSKRAVFFIGGYDPKSADMFFDRQAREFGRFETLWEVETNETSRTILNNDTTVVRYETSCDAPYETWKTETDFHFMTLDDIVLKRFADPFHTRISRYLRTFADYITSGTALKFVRYAWRFSIYFFYPAMMLICALAISLILAMLVAATGTVLPWLVVPLVFVLTFTAFVKFGAKRYHVLHLMDLWSFSREFIYGKQEQMSQKLDAFAALIVSTAEKQTYDEIILIGHSTGGALILDAAGRAFEKNRTFSEGHTQVHVLTVGSTALKVGLHPAADWYRERLTSMFSSSSIHWAEYQCLSDIINFYKTEPAKLMGFSEKCRIQPVVDIIRLNRMVTAPTYSRIRRNFFRIHYQFVFGNTLRYQYDYPAVVLGPSSLTVRVQRPASYDWLAPGLSMHNGEHG